MKQPKSLYMLFFAEMWERFSFYGMRALLILYMVQSIGWDDDRAVGIYAAYGALVYATPFFGGLIADNFLGYRKSVMFGAILMTLGHFIMAIEQDAAFFGALALLILGNGFFKPNVSSIVGGLYEEGDPRRDGGFTIFYMGINLGAFLAPLICGILGEGISWHLGFGLAGVGMLLGLIVFWKGQHQLGETNGIPPNMEILKKKVLGLISTEYFIYVVTFLLVPIFALMVNYSAIAGWLNIAIAVGALTYLLVLSFTTYEGTDRERLWVILILIVFSTLFWAFFEQAGSSISLYTARNVDRSLFGIMLPASVFQSVNPLFIILLAPFFASMWLKLRLKGKEPSTPVKFVLGIAQLGLGFFVLVLGASLAGDNGMSALIFLILGYLLHTTGELCLSPVGLSMVTKLSPKKIGAMAMGVWFISSSLAHIVGGVIAQQTSTSQFKVAKIEYSPNVGQVEPVSFALNVYDADSSVSEDITVNVSFVDEMEAEEAQPLGTYRRYISVAAGQDTVLNLKSVYLDPTGDLTDVKVLENQVSNGTVKVDGDKLTFSGTTVDSLKGESIFSYDVCMKEGGDCQRVDLVMTVNDGQNSKPELLASELNYVMKKRTFFSKFLGEAAITVPVLDKVYDIDGDKLSINIVKKPEMGRAKHASGLHTFATANKMINIYSNVFQFIGIICMVAVGVLILLVPALKKWMHGIS